LDGDSSGRLGCGATIGYGVIKLSPDSLRISVVDGDVLNQWLDKVSVQPQILKTVARPILADQLPKSHVQQPLKKTQIQLNILPTAAFLINDSSQDTAAKGTGAPRLNCMVENNYLKIPGSSIKGVIRSHMRRIMLTMLDHLNDTQSDSLNWIDLNNLTDNLLPHRQSATNSIRKQRTNRCIMVHACFFNYRSD